MIWHYYYQGQYPLHPSVSLFSNRNHDPGTHSKFQDTDYTYIHTYGQLNKANSLNSMNWGDGKKLEDLE